jgi:predicted CXXCH cytochrome family protein
MEIGECLPTTTLFISRIFLEKNLNSFFMNHIKLIFFLTIPFCLLPLISMGQIEFPKSPDTAKQCSICHYRWVSVFFLERRGTPLAPFQAERVVGTREMCLSCHDGSVRDARDTVCNDPGHRIGNIPSDRVNIPENFPLDDNGAMQCSTCHTPHAIKAKKGTLVEFFLRARNKDSSLCKRCHISATGGTAKGNHPVEIESNTVPPEIINAGGKFGTSQPNEIICETGHMPHGGINKKLLVLPVKDSAARSVLCEACHTTNPSLANHQKTSYSSHPLDMLPGKAAQIPQQWANGEQVFLGTSGELVCRTCHNPHYAEDKEFLLVEHRGNDSLCTQCHPEQSRITGSSHDLRKSAPEEKNVLNKQARETGPCASCHLVHRGVGNFMWARNLKTNGSDSSQFCTNCHTQGECAEGSMPGDFSHPMGLSLPENTYPIALPLFDQTGKQNPAGTISCSTCHDLHSPRFLHDDNSGGGATAEFFLRIPSNQDPSALCITCHPEQSQIVSTKHDLQLSDKPFTNALGNTLQSTGICSPCHVAHGAATQQYLWPGPPNRVNNPELPGEAEPHSAVMQMMCTSCHSDSTVTSSAVPSYTFHPAELVFPESTRSLIWEQFPLFSESGRPSPDGEVLCATCHNPHQWHASAKAETPGTDPAGTIMSSFLRQEIDRKLCASCHGEESLFKFLYFHRLNSRKEVSFPQLLRKR